MLSSECSPDADNIALAAWPSAYILNQPDRRPTIDSRNDSLPYPQTWNISTLKDPERRFAKSCF
jgi:hypothetical protein